MLKGFWVPSLLDWHAAWFLVIKLEKYCFKSLGEFCPSTCGDFYLRDESVTVSIAIGLQYA